MKKNETTSALNSPEKNKEELITDKWDKKLNDYENYVKEYLIHYKKLNIRLSELSFLK